jgi:hypothetical protein
LQATCDFVVSILAVKKILTVTIFSNMDESTAKATSTTATLGDGSRLAHERPCTEIV